MLSRQEIEAAKAEKMRIAPKTVIESIRLYREMNRQKKALEKQMEPHKKVIQDYVIRYDANNLLDPEDGTNLVTYSKSGQKVEYDLKKMLEENGEDFMKKYEVVKDTPRRLTIR